MGENASEVWGRWPQEVLSDDYAAKRIKSAEGKKLTPVLVNKEDCFGYFQGDHGRYETFLDSCTCGDFIRAKRPCKHIFRLAMELGLIGGNVQADAKAIPQVRSELVPLSDLLDKVELLSEAQQLMLLTAARNKDGGKVLIGPDLDALLSENYVEYVKEPTSRMKYAPVRCCNWYSRDQLHKYLHRKYEDNVVFDADMAEIRTRLLDTSLPDDLATAELIKRGYYSRDKM